MTLAAWNFVETSLNLAVPGVGLGPAVPLPAYAGNAILLTETDSGGFTFDTPSYSVHLPENQAAFDPCCNSGLHFSMSFTFSDPLSGHVDLLGHIDELLMEIINNDVTLGFAASDGELLGCHSQCLFSGHWERVTHTPEPAFGITFIALALFAFAMTRSIHRNRGC